MHHVDHTRQNHANTPSIVSQDSTQAGAKETRTGNISLATVIAKIMERGFGPKGAKKLIINVRNPLGWSSDTTNLTSDGYAILARAFGSFLFSLKLANKLEKKRLLDRKT